MTEETTEAPKKTRATATKAKVPAIYGKMHAITSNMPTLEKNGVGPSTQGSYKFLAVDDVLHAVKPLLNEHGVIVSPTLIDKGFTFNSAAVKEDGRVPRQNVHAWVEYEYRFIAVEDGSEISVTVVGEGIDSQDKAIRKATTSASKIAFINAFTLITGEIDPDAQDGGADAQKEARVPEAVRKAQAAPAAPSEDLSALRARVKEVAGDRDYMALGNENLGRGWTSDADKLRKLIQMLEAGETA